MPWYDQIDWVALAAFLAAFAALFGTYSAMQSSRRSERATMELKILEFRHEWIDKLRNQMVAFHSATMASKADGFRTFTMYDYQKTLSHAKSVQFLMNPEDPDYENLIRMMTLLSKTALDNSLSLDEVSSNFSRYTIVCQRILKREWERLKLDKERCLDAKNQ